MLRATSLVAGLLLVGACADLIGAGFDTYEVEPTSTGAGGASTTSNTTGTLATSSSGGGEAGATSSSTDTSSTSTGVTCEEWPPTSGAWKWATQVSLDGGTSLQLAAVVPSTAPLFPWVAIGSYSGTLFEGLAPEQTTTHEAPFFAGIGPTGVDLGGALAVTCEEPCDSIGVSDAASDPSAWQGEGHGWVVGVYRGTFLGRTGADSGTPFVLRYNQTEDGAHTLQTSTFLPSEEKAGGEPGTFDAVFAGDGQIAVAGEAEAVSLFGLPVPASGPQYFIGLAIPFPIFQDRRGGRVTGSLTPSGCDDDDGNGVHARELDISVAGGRVWTVGRHCGRGPKSTTPATEPGDGFVLVEDVGNNTNPPSVNNPSTSTLNFGAAARAIATLDETTAVVVGEVLPGDATPRLPNDEDPFLDANDSAAWVSLVDDESEGAPLSVRWTTLLDAPGQQHVVDVAVRRPDASTLEVFVAGITDTPLESDGFTSSCAPGGPSLGFVAKLDGEGRIVWVRTFGRDGVLPVSLRVGPSGLIVGATTGVGDYDLEPTVDPTPIHLEPAAASFFVGELTF